MAKLVSLAKLISIYAVSILAGAVVSLVMLYHIIRKGPSTVFYKKKYETRPRVFHDAAVGKHGYVTLEVGWNMNKSK